MQSDKTLKKSSKPAKEKTLGAVETPKAEIVKKGRAAQSSPAKPTAAKKSGASPKHHHSATVERASVAVATGKVHGSEDVARLAYSFWVERNYAEGSPDEDWLRAERELTSAR